MGTRGKLFRSLRRGRGRVADGATPEQAPPRADTAAPPAAPDPNPRVRLELAAELRAARGEPAPATPPTGADALRARLESDTPADRARRRYQRHLDDAIAEAEARGDFANLRLKGKPIPAELLVSQDEAWLANHAMANAGFTPPWLQLRQEIDDNLAECLRLVERAERFPPRVNRELPLRDLRQRLDATRAKARRYNLMVPIMALQRPLPNTDDLLRRMAAAVDLPLEEQPSA